MYLEHYGFQEKPFTITPNPRFIFLSKHHKEAFAHLLFGIRTRAGFITLTGEIGTGKTTVLRSLLGEISSDDSYRAALILNPCVSDVELLRAINREFGVPESSSKAESIHLLNEFLLKQNTEGRTIVLVIDEAQNLLPEVLEQIRLISNLETDTTKLIQIILAGQPELGDLLRRKELRQLAQRVTVSYHLLPMDYTDVRAYIEHRIMLAGFWGKTLFTRSALRHIYRHSGGTPRLVNIVCDRALLIGFTVEAREINANLVKKGIRELRRGRTHRSRRWLPFALAALFAVVFISLYLFMQIKIHSAPPRNDTATAAPLSDDLTAFKAALAASSQQESARMAFNAIAPLWNVTPLQKSASTSGHPIIGLATDQSLQTYRFRGTLKTLLAMNSPAILELHSSGDENRFIAMVGSDGDRIFISPVTGGRSFLTLSEIEDLWTGDAFLLWRNRLNLTVSDQNGDNVRNIQALLKICGFYKGLLNGSYDKATKLAVRRFQAAQGITSDGILGRRTLFLLNKIAGDPSAPTLSKGETRQ